MFTSYGFYIEDKNNNKIYSEKTALEYLTIEDVGKDVYFINENRMTTILDRSKTMQRVGFWKSLNVIQIEI